VKITALKQQVKNKERVSVFLDDKYEFSLSLGELVKYGLKNGDELSPAEAKKFKQVSEDGKTSARALEWVLNRPHSVREFSDYMRRKKTDPSLTERLADEFKGKNYLSDEKFAGWLVELKAGAGKSNRQIRAELFKKGINRELAEQALLEFGDESERLRAIIAKKKTLSRYQDSIKFRRYLISQGFSYDLIKKELDSK